MFYRALIKRVLIMQLYLSGDGATKIHQSLVSDIMISLTKKLLVLVIIVDNFISGPELDTNGKRIKGKRVTYFDID